MKNNNNRQTKNNNNKQMNNDLEYFKKVQDTYIINEIQKQKENFIKSEILDGEFNKTIKYLKNISNTHYINNDDIGDLSIEFLEHDEYNKNEQPCDF
jgi:hypothetical protein